MANEVLFKRGTQAALDLLRGAANSAVEGSFYLTSDTNRLYIGKNLGTAGSPDVRPVAVNQGVHTVANVSALSGVSVTNDNMGQFYYCTAENVLCVLSGSTDGGGTPRWVQINPDTNTVVSGLDIEVSTTSGVTTVNTVISQEKDVGTGTPQALQDQESSFTLTGDNGVTVSSSGDAITIAGEKYSISIAESATPGTYTLKLASDGQDSAAHDRDTTIPIIQGSNITLDVNASTGALTISATDTTLNPNATGSQAELDISTGIASGNTNGFKVTVADSQGNEVSDTVDPTIQLGTHSDALVHFDGGKATLDVYTKSEVDNKISDFNAMAYAGTLGQGGAYTNINIGASGAASTTLTEVHSGDTFKVAENVDDLLAANKLKDKQGKYYGAKTSDDDTTHNGIILTSGDLLIANGTEDSNGNITSASLYFDYVPSGDDEDSTYNTEVIDNGSKIFKSNNPSNPQYIGGIQLDAGGEINLSDNQTAGTTGVVNKVTIAHKTQTGLSASNTATPAADTTSGHNTDANDGYTMSAASGTTSNYLNIKVPEINYNQYGHITSIGWKTYRVIDSHGSGTTIQDFLIQSASSSGNAAASVLTATATMRLQTQNSSSQNENFDLVLASNTLNMTKGGTNDSYDLKIDLLWGTF